MGCSYRGVHMSRGGLASFAPAEWRKTCSFWQPDTCHELPCVKNESVKHAVFCRARVSAGIAEILPVNLPQFDKIYDWNSEQENVFVEVAQPIIEQVPMMPSHITPQQ
jgi:hypothetical protein